MCYQQLETPSLLGRFSPDQEGHREANRFFPVQYLLLHRKDGVQRSHQSPPILPARAGGAEATGNTEQERLLTLGSGAPRTDTDGATLSTGEDSRARPGAARRRPAAPAGSVVSARSCPGQGDPLDGCLAKDSVCAPAGNAHSFERRIKCG